MEFDIQEYFDVLIHELDYPLVGILSTTQWIAARKQSNDKWENDVLRIQRFAEFMRQKLEVASLVNRLYRSKPIYPYKSKFDLLEVINESVSLMEPALFQRHIKIEVDTTGFPMMSQIYADRAHMSIVFSHLLDNAVNSRISDQVSVIRIGLESFESGIVVKVFDWGLGIHPESIDNLFELGWRSEYSKKRLRDCGVGLWLCRLLLQANNMQIAVAHSHLPTVFEVTIPRSCLE
jgi:signal transduction histidine kinase